MLFLRKLLNPLFLGVIAFSLSGVASATSVKRVNSYVVEQSLNKKNNAWESGVAYKSLELLKVNGVSSNFRVFMIERGLETEYAIVKIENDNVLNVQKDMYLIDFLNSEIKVFNRENYYNLMSKSYYGARGKDLKLFKKEDFDIGWNLGKSFVLDGDRLESASKSDVISEKNKSKSIYPKSADNSWNSLSYKYSIPESLSKNLIQAMRLNNKSFTLLNTVDFVDKSKILVYSFNGFDFSFLKDVVFVEYVKAGLSLDKSINSVERLSQSSFPILAFNKNVWDKIVLNEDLNDMPLIFSKQSKDYMVGLIPYEKNEASNLMMILDMGNISDMWNMPSLSKYENLKSAYLMKKDKFLNALNRGRHLENKIVLSEKVSFQPDLVVISKTGAWIFLQKASNAEVTVKDNKLKKELDDFYLVYKNPSFNFDCVKSVVIRSCDFSLNPEETYFLHKDGLDIYLDPSLFNAFNFYLPSLKSKRELKVKNTVDYYNSGEKSVLYFSESMINSLTAFSIKYSESEQKKDFSYVYIQSFTNPEKLLKFRILNSQITNVYDGTSGKARINLYQLFFATEEFKRKRKEALY